MRTREQAFNIISNWHNVSVSGRVESIDIFFQFMASWVSFNALYNWYGRNSRERADRRKLTHFASTNQTASETHQQLLQSNESYRNAVGVLEANGILDVSSGQRVHIANNANFEQVILCVYQVRNNLFHGDKMVGDARDEEVVTASFAIVSNFLRDYLNSPKQN